ncbi:hypothetical protein [Dyadobacter jiangsuensis]|uniref:Uncharacterized protein n=1 Tax=Dyadobacter jiangsuensis TaxID=1591085 RepID=A0A2P8FP43_9BACT|nr:hypothetical protein [Dyadobacter jiangsuensis]PSL23496.1 hypothetical protein CLV60_11651 [Dyadobacter jiangsuensis]
MIEAETILRLIETVDPNDTEKLDEIDARVYCYVRPEEFSYVSMSDNTDKDYCCYSFIAKYLGPKEKFVGLDMSRLIIRYTRSREELKAIRPDGVKWIRTTFCVDMGSISSIHIGSTIIDAGVLPTEELSELHAIIQAIDYERRSSQNHTNK